jgi:hypothetical protein
MPAIRAKPTRSYLHVPGNAPQEHRKADHFFIAKNEIAKIRYKFKVSKESKEKFRTTGAPEWRTPVSGYQLKVWTLDHLPQEEIDRRLAESASSFDQEQLDIRYPLSPVKSPSRGGDAKRE